DGLPEKVRAADLTLAPGQDKAKLKLTGDAPAGSWTIRLLGKGEADGKAIERRALAPVTNAAELAVASAPKYADDLLLTVTMPPPFRIEADDSYVFMNLGTLYPAKVKIIRSPGFTGPITLSIADRQPRDPQGITFDPITISDQATEVSIPMRLPQGPRGNPIVRMHVKGEGMIRDAEGRERHVVQTSVKQVVLRTQAPVFSMEAEPSVLRAVPGTRVPVRFRLGRTAVVPAAAEVRLRLPEGTRGISMDPVTIPAGQSEIEAVLTVAADAVLGAEDQLWLEGSTKRSDNGYTVFFRTPVELDLRAPAR
ncbi:MAG: hypothetical protein K0Q72_4675, partial [Armatimonadetes bacterium]|nr:hypothetical protein [Armatimonadota bacterium]